MRIIRPATVEDLTLTIGSTNIPTAPPAAYNAGTTYADGDEVSVLQADGYTYKVYESLVGSNTGNAVTDTDFWLYLADTYAAYSGATTYDLDDIVTSGNHEYQSLQASNTGHSLSDAAWWLDLGSTNEYDMFDNSNSTQTQRAEVISFTVTVSGRADSVSLLNIVGDSVNITMTTVADGEIFNQDYDLSVDNDVSNWFEYFFEPVTRKGDLVVYDLPNNLNPTFTVTMLQPGSTAKIGAAVIGQSRDLGELLYGARVGIQDYSRKETDDFGNFYIVERAFAKRATYKVWVDNDRVDSIVTLLAQYRATACVYVGVDSLTSTWIYGFYKDFEVEIAFMEKSYLSLVLEGLT